MDINAEVSTQLSLIDALLSDLDKTITPCASKKNEKKEEETQDAMPDSTTNTEKNNANPFHCGDDVLVPNKDGRYYLGTIVELSTSNDNDSCEVGTGTARCLVKFGDGTHAWAPVASLKLLSAPPADDGRIMCVVCKRREGPAASPATNAIIACDMCGRGYHAKCHSPPVDAWINGASWHCKRCVDQRYRVAAAENRALKRSDLFRFKGGQQRRQQQELTPPCDTASTTSSASVSDAGKDQNETHCYCGEKSDWLAQMLLCCRCSRWFHQRCVSSLQYPLYAGDKLYIFACAHCNGGAEYLRRLELCWLDLAHLALYNLTAYNAPNYFDLDNVIMPYIMDNWHALQLPEKMWRTPVKERREKILTALTSSRKRFKCGREMKKRATIWGLRLRRPPPPPLQLSALEQIKKGDPLTDKLVREYAPRLRFLPRAPSPQTVVDDSSQPSSSNIDKSSYKNHNQRMIVPVDGHWLNLMMGKRFHENLNSNSNSENDSTSSYESVKPTENDEQPSPVPSICASSPRTSDAKADNLEKISELTEIVTTNETKSICDEPPPVPSLNTSLVSCSVKLDNISKENIVDTNVSKNDVTNVNINTHTTRIATMNLELSKLSTKNIIEHSKIMSLHHMDSFPPYTSNFTHDMESSGDETSSRGTLDIIIPPLKDFQGKNNPFLMQNSYSSKRPFLSSSVYSKLNGKQNNHHSRFSLPVNLNPAMGPLVRPMKRKLSEKDIIIGPNGEVKRRKYRRPRKYLQQQLNKSCPLPDDNNKPAQIPNENGEVAPPAGALTNNVKFHGRRLRQRQEKNYYENARRNTNNNSSNNNSVKSLQLSPHKANSTAAEVNAEQLSALKSSVQSYFRAGQTFHVLARRLAPGAAPAYLIEWDSNAS
ncbi:metal-response element-binding transcription factor 2 isoform X2 [Spodoptera frugiperda]|uniref:Metal-response element-binding transcription factor 2 isoform X2 n=1 Tax=Spodoptera frugiperda TaxID=7108 RepID=A0A9R0EFA4_SPOFR|nr:metal-response element-binding transcription factor 2 isoform X2 [Spodoptera frugiperda]